MLSKVVEFKVKVKTNEYVYYALRKSNNELLNACKNFKKKQNYHLHSREITQ